MTNASWLARVIVTPKPVVNDPQGLTVAQGLRTLGFDEVLTPDSSRYWEPAGYQVGISPPSYDKQFVRDWLSRSGWDKNSKPPELPQDVVAQTRDRYLTAYQRIVGKPLFPPKGRNE